ncbi:MAG: STAS domain-containing protein [Bacillota bacterium]
MNLIIDENNNAGILQLTGSLTIERMSELKEVLISSLEKVDHLRVDHSGSESFDHSYLQLLFACAKTAGEKKKKLTVEYNIRSGFNEVVQASGFPEPDFYSPQEISRV